MLERSVVRVALDCDDPYRVLAYNIVALYPPPTVRRFVRDPKFLRREIVRETRGQDLRGIFADCLLVSIQKEGNQQALNDQLSVLGRFLYSNLDLGRMRKEIRSAYARLGLEYLLD